MGATITPYEFAKEFPLQYNIRLGEESFYGNVNRVNTNKLHIM